MKYRIMRLWVMVLMYGGALAADGGDGSSGAGSLTWDVASACVFRGATLNDRPVAQPSLAVEALPRLTLGVWGNLDMDRKDGPDRQFSEVDLSTSYGFEWKGLDFSALYTEYLYPNSAMPADREVGFSVAYALPIRPSLTVAYGVGGAVRKSLYVEGGLNVGREIAEGLTIGVGGRLAYAAPDGGEDGLSHYVLTAGAGYAFVTASISYIGRVNSDVLSDESYDKKWMAKLSFSRSF